jgi:hypothetical protein
MTGTSERRARRNEPRDPWAQAPVGELQEQLLPRWFVLVGVVAVVAMIATAIGAFLVFGPEEVPVEARRPPPGPALTHEVGEHLIGDTAEVDYDAACPQLEGLRIAGTPADQALLRQALAGLCNTPLPADAEAALAAFADSGGVVRFALFEATGVDSAAQLDGERILVNAKFVQLDRARWIAPVIAHDAVVLAGEPQSAETALRAREIEDLVCSRLLGSEDPSRGCDDAAAVVGLPDPLGALRDVGFE